VSAAAVCVVVMNDGEFIFLCGDHEFDDDDDDDDDDNNAGMIIN